jgi:hypothetical protein
VVRLSFTARIERPPLHRGGSASTETMPAVSRSPFKLACVPSLGRAPMLVYVRPSNETTDDPSKLARYLFRDGG